MSKTVYIYKSGCSFKFEISEDVIESIEEKEKEVNNSDENGWVQEYKYYIEGKSDEKERCLQAFINVTQEETSLKMNSHEGELKINTYPDLKDTRKDVLFDRQILYVICDNDISGKVIDLPRRRIREIQSKKPDEKEQEEFIEYLESLVEDVTNDIESEHIKDLKRACHKYRRRTR